MKQPNLQIFTYELAAAAVIAIHAQGRFFRILEADGDVGVQIDAAPEIILDQGFGFELPAGETFEQLRLINRAAATQTVEVALGVGKFDDSRISGTITSQEAMPDTLTSGAAVSAANLATTLLAAANAARREVLVRNQGAGTVYVGGVLGALAGEGIELKAGETITLATTAAVYARNDSGGAVALGVIELERS